jgi:hypothetical protein
MRPNASYFFTALPKNKTLDDHRGEGNTIKHRRERSRIVSWIAVIKHGWLGLFRRL